ncbi:MAG: hypothetical protein ACLP70_07425 [Streptosporangiaceae bacterium]
MGYLLAMSAEFRDWLADLSVSDPASARLAGAALAALLAEGAGLGPPAVTRIDDGPRYRGAALGAALEQTRQRKLERLAVARSHTTEAAELVTDIDHQLDELRTLQATLGGQHLRAVRAGRQDLADELADNLAGTADHLAELRQRLPGVIRNREQLAAKSQRLQEQFDAFTARTESLKARFRAAEGARAAEEAIAAVTRAAGDASQPGRDADAPAEGAESPA